jgi:hypothetical protein
MQTTTTPTPSGGPDAGIMLQRRARTAAITVTIMFLFVWQADLWLATPDVAVALANKTMALVDSPLGESPVWLRVGIGAMLAMSLISITAFARLYGDDGGDRTALMALSGTDSTESRQLRRSTWAKRGMKISLMVLLGAMFAYLFRFDVERAHLSLDVQELGRETQEWGLSLADGQSLMVEADPTAEIVAAPDTGGSALNLAMPSAVAYGLLWLLHGVLLMMPVRSRSPLSSRMVVQGGSASDDVEASDLV